MLNFKNIAFVSSLITLCHFAFAGDLQVGERVGKINEANFGSYLGVHDHQISGILPNGNYSLVGVIQCCGTPSGFTRDVLVKETEQATGTLEKGDHAEVCFDYIAWRVCHEGVVIRTYERGYVRLLTKKIYRVFFDGQKSIPEEYPDNNNERFSDFFSTSELSYALIERFKSPAHATVEKTSK